MAQLQNTPKIYVSTYNYNNSSLQGIWINLINFKKYEYLQTYLKKVFGAESELMVQDSENIFQLNEYRNRIIN